jgi:GxxExxY protein
MDMFGLQMNFKNQNYEINELTELIINAAYKVGNTLGLGFLEKVYENSLAYELYLTNLDVKQQYSIDVKYKGMITGHYIADLLVNDSVLIEVKSVKDFENAHFAQCLNYLKATGLRVCLLINFSKPKVEVKRIVNNF